jgi:hypothetical protein
MRRAWLGATGLFLLAAAPASAPLRDALWTDSNADVAAVLTHAPAECLARPRDPAAYHAVLIGRTLFRSPGLLGGPAARLGLSCNACHPNGHSNAAFDLPELTDKPGAADVTAEWASAVRGDGIMNPVPIPDLTDVGARAALGHLKEPSLERFVAKAVTEEFQGAPLPPAAMAGLLSYLRALTRTTCPPTASTALTLKSAAEEVEDAILAASGQDVSTARLLLFAAQEAMGRIAERLPTARFDAERGKLEALSREVGSWRAAPLFLGWDRVHDWVGRFEGLVHALQAHEGETYFNAATLRAALK